MLSIGDRMKEYYENKSRYYLTRRIPVIMRLDGRAFTKLTKHLDKPFSETFNDVMCETARYLLSEIQGAKCVYTQSDEISILITDFERLTTDCWFGYNIQKMTSISAAMASVYFNTYCHLHNNTMYAGIFDSRVFNIPKEDTCNYFIWRQQDWTKNSVQMLARSYFSHSELQGKNQGEMHNMLYYKNVNWNNLDPKWKNGAFFTKSDGEIIKMEDFIFSKKRELIDNHLYI